MPNYKKKADVSYNVTIFCDDQEKLNAMQGQLERLDEVKHLDITQQSQALLEDIGKQSDYQVSGGQESSNIANVICVVCDNSEKYDLVIEIAKIQGVSTIIACTSVRVCYFTN